MVVGQWRGGQSQVHSGRGVAARLLQPGGVEDKARCTEESRIFNQVEGRLEPGTHRRGRVAARWIRRMEPGAQRRV